MASAYHITICSHNRELIFSEIDDSGVVHLLELGEIIDEEWRKIGEVRPDVLVDEFVIMPNHLHGILLLTAGESDDTPRQFGGSLPDTVSSIVGQTKAAVTKRAWKLEKWAGKRILQSRFHDRIIRNDPELESTRLYIRNNPFEWAFDPDNPAVVKSWMVSIRRM